MPPTVAQLIFIESGGFAGLQRGCTVAPAALPEATRRALQSLVQVRGEAIGSAGSVGAAPDQASSPNMPDMQTYTLELIFDKRSDAGTAPANAAATPADAAASRRVMQMPATDVPPDLAELIGFLREHARPL